MYADNPEPTWWSRDYLSPRLMHGFVSKANSSRSITRTSPLNAIVMQRLYRCAPPIRWIFIPDKKYVMTRNLEDFFYNSLLRAWDHVHKGLGHGVPTCEEEYLRHH